MQSLSKCQLKRLIFHPNAIVKLFGTNKMKYFVQSHEKYFVERMHGFHRFRLWIMHFTETETLDDKVIFFFKISSIILFSHPLRLTGVMHKFSLNPKCWYCAFRLPFFPTKVIGGDTDVCSTYFANVFSSLQYLCTVLSALPSVLSKKENSFIQGLARFLCSYCCHLWYSTHYGLAHSKARNHPVLLKRKSRRPRVTIHRINLWMAMIAKQRPTMTNRDDLHNNILTVSGIVRRTIHYRFFTELNLPAKRPVEKPLIVK